MIRDKTARKADSQGRLVLAVALGVGLLASSPALAGDYHYQSSLNCSECHVMHFSQGHGYGPGGSGTFVQLGGVTPNRKLLRNSVNDLCLACHDGSTMATDVLGSTNTGSQPGIVRTAGYLNRIGMAGALNTGHTLDALDTAPGSVPSWSPQTENGTGFGLTCINCHDPHGSVATQHPTGNQYRNLRTNPGRSVRAWVTYNHATPGTNQLSRDVFLRQARAYDETRMDWNEPDDQRSAIARWCGGCHSFAHGNWIGEGGSGSAPSGVYPFLRDHPVEKQDFGNDEVSQYNSRVNKVKVMSEIGIWSPAGRDVTPTCTTCHRAHGNGNPDGLIFRSGTGTRTENGDTNGSTLDHLCKQCHNDGVNHN